MNYPGYTSKKRYLIIIIPLLFLASCFSKKIGIDAFPPSEIKSIQINDNWNGLSPNAPIIREYHLENTGNMYTGTAHLSYGGYSDNPKTKSKSIEVPSEDISAFLNKLAKSPIQKGKYEPKITHTDDYPTIIIEITLTNTKIKFFSESQGIHNVPWGVILDGETYVINSRNPSKALEILEPYLVFSQ